jgi:hypothetical protein
LLGLSAGVVTKMPLPVAKLGAVFTVKVAALMAVSINNSLRGVWLMADSLVLVKNVYNNRCYGL